MTLGVNPSGPRLTSRRNTASRDSCAKAPSALTTSVDFIIPDISKYRSFVKFESHLDKLLNLQLSLSLLVTLRSGVNKLANGSIWELTYYS